MNRFHVRFVSLLSAGFVSAAVMLADGSLPIIDIAGAEYYVYKSKKGETLFKIARENDWDESVLIRLNPDASSPLPKDFLIYYPVSAKENVPKQVANSVASPVENGKAREYVIKPGDTLFALARANSTTVAQIMKLNPGVSEKNFRAGETIMIPSPGEGVEIKNMVVEDTLLREFSSYKVGKDETWSGVSRKTGVTVDKLKEANPGIGRLKNKMIIAIPVMETVETEKEVKVTDSREESPEGIREIYSEIHRLADSQQLDTLKLALLLEDPSSKKDLEFTRGFLSALHTMKHATLPVALKVIDSTRSSTDIIEELGEFAPSLLFSTAEKNIPSYLGEYAMVSCTPLINIFDVRNEYYKTNPYVVQLITPSDGFNESVASYVADKYGDSLFISAGAEDSEDQLGSSLRSRWNASKLVSVSIENLADFPIKEDAKVVIYGNPVKKGDVVALLDQVIAIKETNPFADIIVLGRPNWIVLDELLSEKFHKAGVMIPSRFYYDSKSSSAEQFNASYKELFSRQPQNTFPMYAPYGYDTARYFVLGMTDARFDLNNMRESSGGVQSDFVLVRDKSWTGPVNPIVYLVRFTPFDTIDRIKVK